MATGVRASEDMPSPSVRSVLGYVEDGPLARFGFRWFARVEAEGEPPLIVWTRSHRDAWKVLAAFVAPDHAPGA
jgi:hypothetical protein